MPYTTNINIESRDSILREEVNFLSPIGFRLIIDNLSFKNAQFYIQLASLPNLQATPAPYNTPQRNIGIHADKLVYEPFSCTFIIDEDLINYTEIHDWLVSQVTENDTKKKTRDMTLAILSSHNNVTREIQFVDAYPTDLASLPFDTTQSDVEYLTAAVTFEYSYYKII